MSTETDIVEKANLELVKAGREWSYSPLVEDLVKEITKLRAERDAAARDMRERCKIEARKIAVEMINNLATPPNVRGFLYDDSHLKYGHKVACCIENAIAALPDAVIATSGKDAT